MKPCDCKDRLTALTELNEQGIYFADVSIKVSPDTVVLEVGACSFKIPMSHFKRLAEWYLKDQKDE